MGKIVKLYNPKPNPVHEHLTEVHSKMMARAIERWKKKIKKPKKSCL